MNHQIGLGAFGTFGEPFGYQQVFFLNAAFNSSLDLNTNAIEVYPGSELYAVKREITNGICSVSCCIYSYAKELNSNRGGTFIGSCVVLNNSRLKGEDIYALLKELHTDLIGNPKNIVDNTIQVQKAAQLIVTEPGIFTAIKAKATSPTTIAPHIDTQKKFLIQAPANELVTARHISSFLEDAIEYFTDTDTLYFTTDQRIVAYVSEKGLIKNAGWKEFADYKLAKQQEESEAKKKAEWQKKQEKNQSPVKNVKTGTKENTGKPVKTFGLYETWVDTDGSISKESFRKMIKDHNILLEEYSKLKNQQTLPLPVSSNNADHQYKKSSSTFRVKKKHLMLTIIVLFVLLVTTSVLLFLSQANLTKQMAAASSLPQPADSNLPAKVVVPPKALMPISNIELTKAEIGKLAKEKIKGRNINTIVDLLFLRNPGNIGEVYLGQKEAYAALLLRNNANCFKEDSASYTCTCDTLMHLPGFKK